MPRPKQADGDSRLVRLSAELIYKELQESGGRYPNSYFQEVLKTSRSTVLKAIHRLMRQNLVSSSRSGVETFYFLFSCQKKHLHELEVINQKRAEAAKEANRNRVKKRDRALASRPKADVLKSLFDKTRLKLVSVEENEDFRTGSIRYFKYMNDLKCEGVNKPQ